MELFISMPGGAEFILIACGLLFLLIPLIALIQIIKSEFTHAENKIIWVVIVLLLPFIGSILWWTMGRAQKVN